MLYIEKSLLSEMIANVESFPEERCGFLFGHETQEYRTITKTRLAENVTQGDKHRRFEIGPLDYLSAENYAEKNKLQLLGIYHSHPDHIAVPSELDRSGAQPGFSYIIISTMHKKFSAIRSWRLNSSSQFEEEQINDQNIHQFNKINGNRIHSNTTA